MNDILMNAGFLLQELQHLSSWIIITYFIWFQLHITYYYYMDAD